MERGRSSGCVGQPPLLELDDLDPNALKRTGVFAADDTMNDRLGWARLGLNGLRAQTRTDSGGDEPQDPARIYT